MELNDIEVPQTPAGRTALEAATYFYSPALLNHCIRSYIWASAYASTNHMDHDPELLYVAALLHDLGLVAEFDSHTVAFEDVGGDLAWLFSAGADWPTARRERVAQVVVRHMAVTVDPDEDPEGFLLEMSTAVDISGRDARDFPAASPQSGAGEISAPQPRRRIHGLPSGAVASKAGQPGRPAVAGRGQRSHRAQPARRAGANRVTTQTD